MSYTFSDMQDKLGSLLGDPNEAADDQFPLAVRKKEINRGEMQLCKDSMSVREKATGTISSSQISIPSDMLQIHVLIVNNYVITRDREVSVEDWERHYNHGGNIPLYYISEESGTRYIKFFGSVNGLAYSLFYFKKPGTEMSDDSDTSILPEEFREGAVYYAASELLRQIGKNDIANLYFQRYQVIVRDAEKYAEELYMKKSYARPDVNIMTSEQDIIGGGFDYAMGGFG